MRLLILEKGDNNFVAVFASFHKHWKDESVKNLLIYFLYQKLVVENLDHSFDASVAIVYLQVPVN